MLEIAPLAHHYHRKACVIWDYRFYHQNSLEIIKLSNVSEEKFDLFIV